MPVKPPQACKGLSERAHLKLLNTNLLENIIFCTFTSNANFHQRSTNTMTPLGIPWHSSFGRRAIFHAGIQTNALDLTTCVTQNSHGHTIHTTQMSYICVLENNHCAMASMRKPQAQVRGTFQCVLNATPVLVMLPMLSKA